MIFLQDLILIYPIRESLVQSLPLGDLFNLSKTNATIRAAFHGFEFEKHDQGLLPSVHARPPLLIAQHNTLYWKICKSKSLLLCSEPHHVRGEKVQGCRICSMPVCEACLIKSSFGKRDERTFSNRARSLCPDCYNCDNVHIGNLLKPTGIDHLPPGYNPERLTCICTAKDGHICMKCKAKQKSDAEQKLDRCHGEGCSRVQEGGFLGRICLWCDLRLPSDCSRATARRQYDLLHLIARSHTMYEHPSDDEIVNPAAQLARWNSSQAQPGIPYQARPRPFDPIEEERQLELSRVSLRRSLGTDAAEEERWRLSESLRRSDTFKPPPPTKWQRTTPVMDSISWRDTDSTAPTLLERDLWEAPDPPPYSEGDGKSSPEPMQSPPPDKP